MIIDRLYNEVKEKSCICVGLDVEIENIPKNILKCEDPIFEYNKRIIDATNDLVAAYKLQIAHYEALGIKGLISYQKTLKYLKDKGIISIGDVKRSDISSTAKKYAKAHFESDFETDIITLNPYMGLDSIEPYLEYLGKKEKGVFILLRTSNKGANDIECLKYGDEELFYTIGDMLSSVASKLKGEIGYSSLGFVVGATHENEANKIRERYKDIFFLIPGYGAQGGSSETVRKYLNNFNGGIVNSSRGIITYYKSFEDGEEKFEFYTRQAVINMREDIYDEKRI